ncbi:MAG: hypothetical protein ACRCTY_07630, partial [Candidatus Adiutrix sp.]
MLSRIIFPMLLLVFMLLPMACTVPPKAKNQSLSVCSSDFRPTDNNEISSRQGPNLTCTGTI